MGSGIYLDANATSRLRGSARDVLKAMLDQAGVLANASSIHHPGRRSRALLRSARNDLTDLLSLRSAQDASSRSRRSCGAIHFTSGGTESCNQMIYGFLGDAETRVRHPGHIIASGIEHAAIAEPLAQLERQGWDVSYVDPQSDGRCAVSSFTAALRPDTALVTCMAANNETGAIQPLAELARDLRTLGFSGAITSDATQAIGKSRFDLPLLFEAGVSAIAFSGHKLGAPAGVGALVLSASKDFCLPFYPHTLGGPQEDGIRPGTENLIGIHCLGAVAREVLETLDDDIARRVSLREQLWSGLQEVAPNIERLGAAPDQSVSNTLLVRLPETRSDDVVVALDIQGIYASTGAACASGKQGHSSTVEHMGLGDAAAREVIRFSVDWDTTSRDILTAVEGFAQVLRNLDDSKRLLDESLTSSKWTVGTPGAAGVRTSLQGEG